MIDKSVAIAALARNCEESLPTNISRIEKLRKSFSCSAVFLYENNSTDRTKAILREWQERNDAVYLQSENIDESIYRANGNVGKLNRGTGEGRIRKMCDCRNKLLDLIKSRGSFDYVIFVDIDIEWFSVEGVVKSIENAPKDWGGLFANCYVTYRNGVQVFDNPMHYDTFAILESGKKLEQIRLSDLNPYRRIILANKIYKEVNNTCYYKCESAFGGIGIYKGEIIEGLKYELYKPMSWNNANSALCEHIFFNSKVAGEKYIAKDLRVRYQWSDVHGMKWMFVRYFPILYSMIGNVIGHLNK